MSFGGGQQAQPPPPPPPPPNPPMYGSEATRRRAGGLNMPARPTFLGTELAATQQQGQTATKTLLGA